MTVRGIWNPVFDCPLGLAQFLYFTESERNGDCRIEGWEDREMATKKALDAAVEKVERGKQEESVMASGLVTSVDANITPYERKMAQLQNIAFQAGRKANAALNAGHGGVKGGAITEMLVMIREIANGRWERIPGSLSIEMVRAGKAAQLLKFILNPITGIVAWHCGWVCRYLSLVKENRGDAVRTEDARLSRRKTS